MSNTEVKNYTELVIPPSTVSKADISRLVREFESLDNALTAQSVRKKANAAPQDLPATSPQLQSFLEANPIDLENSNLRTAYVKQLRMLKNKVPVMHMTFAVVADPESLQQLSAWVRGSIHPQTVIEAHLQPALVAGVYVRSPNHVFDLSVRNKLKSKRGELERELGALRGR